MDAIPPHYKLFKSLELTSRPYALHTVRVATTLMEVDENMAKVRNSLMADCHRSDIENARYASSAAMLVAQTQRNVDEEVEARRDAVDRKRRRVNSTADSRPPSEAESYESG